MDGSSDRKDVRDEVYKILHDVTGIKNNQIDELTPWYELDASSFELVEFIVSIREEFQINLTIQQLIKMKNLQELILFIEKNR